jgi:hypothetical protein
VLWLLENEEVQHCPICKRGEDCKLHGRGPELTTRALWLLTLYRRVKRWKALPAEGGLLDQEERIMRKLDLIDSLVDEDMERKRKLAEARQRLDMQMKSLQARNPRMKFGWG